MTLIWNMNIEPYFKCISHFWQNCLQVNVCIECLESTLDPVGGFLSGVANRLNAFAVLQRGSFFVVLLCSKYASTNFYFAWSFSSCYLWRHIKNKVIVCVGFFLRINWWLLFSQRVFIVMFGFILIVPYGFASLWKQLTTETGWLFCRETLDIQLGSKYTPVKNSLD